MEENELRKMVEETMELSKDNNRMLHSIQRRARTAIVVKVIYWVILVAVAAGALYYVQPYIDQITNAYNGVIDTQHKVADISSKFSFESIKNYFK